MRHATYNPSAFKHHFVDHCDSSTAGLLSWRSGLGEAHTRRDEANMESPIATAPSTAFLDMNVAGWNDTVVQPRQ